MKLLSVIITAEYKENYVKRCIESCLNQNAKNFELIICYTKLKNENLIKKKFSQPNIKFLKIKKKLKNKTQDQFYKIFQGFKISRGDIISLLDGDGTLVWVNLPSNSLDIQLKFVVINISLIVEEYFSLIHLKYSITSLGKNSIFLIIIML